MKRFVILGALLLFAASLFAQDAPAAPSKDDVVAFVKQAIAFEKANGRDKFFSEVINPSGLFHFKAGTKKDLYIFVYDEKGVVLAHGTRLDLVGRDRWNDKDPDGKFWIRDWTDLVHKSGSGWIAYKEYNPSANNNIMNKSSYVTLVDGMVVGCGIYTK